MPAKLNLIGQVFGTLKVLSEAQPYRRPNGAASNARCLCVCLECGAQRAYRNTWLIRRTTTKCECDKTGLFKHGHAGFRAHTSTYHIWGNMISRCHSPKNARYADYGGRGITVCERWHDFANFLADMGERPPKLTLERIDNNKGYCKENCKWATRLEQAHNKRNATMLTVRGVTDSLKRLCHHFGAQYPRVHHRIAQGWDIETAIFAPSVYSK